MIAQAISQFENDGRWPPQCCVPAFVFGGLSHLGAKINAPLVLPSFLGVRVGPQDSNPLGLPVARMNETTGITASAATIAIATVLAGIDGNFGFRHLPFSKIEFGLYEDVLRHALDRGVVVGVGVKWSELRTSGSDESPLHLLRVTSFDEGVLTLFDDSHELEVPRFQQDWRNVERAILAAGDGFWLLGNSTNLHVPHAPIFPCAAAS